MKSNVHRSFAMLMLALVFCVPGLSADNRPNIILIVADDMGYTDVGAYGGEISTPNIDALAGEGILFTQFHTAPVCAVTRAMLLSGNNNHVAGLGNQYGFYEAHNDLPGYEGHLSERIAPLPRLLRDAGYHTYSAGKWHLGTAEEHSPRAAGFERHFNMTQGAAAHYGMTGFHEGGSLYREDGEETQFPDGAYAPEYYTDRLIEFIDSNRGDGRPFFVYGAYTSPHWPLQVPDSYLDLYEGRYDDGYDVLRERRFEAAKRAGVISEDHELPPRNPALVPWNDLSADEKRVDAREMELYAALLHHFDEQIGRLIDYLKGADLYDNTLIVFMSDNGAAGSYPARFANGYDNSLANIGKLGSFAEYGRGWAEAAMAPFREVKGSMAEGGVRAAAIASHGSLTDAGGISHAYLTMQDVMPTLLELAGAEHPGGSYRNRPTLPMRGKSFLNHLLAANDPVHDPAEAIGWELHGARALVQGDWKLLWPADDDPRWELYNLRDDPYERNDLAASEPEQLRALVAAWHAYAEEVGVAVVE